MGAFRQRLNQPPNNLVLVAGVVLLLSAVIGLGWWWASAPVRLPESTSQEENEVLIGTSGKDAATTLLPEPSEMAQVFEDRSLMDWRDELSNEQNTRINEWIARYQRARNDAEKVSLLDDSASFEDRAVHAMLVLQAMEYGSPEVQMKALESLVGRAGEEQVVALQRGTVDENLDVRDLSLQVARDQDLEVRLPVFKRAITSDYADTRTSALVELTRESVKAATPVMIEGLRVKDSEFTEAVQRELEIRLSPLYPNTWSDYSEVMNWWESVEGRYDDKMNLTE